VLFVAGIHGAPLRYRALLPAEAIGLYGVESEVLHYRSADVPAAAARADVLVVYRSPASTQLVEVIESVRRRGVPVLFDVDDLIVDPDIASEIPALQLLPPAEAAEWLDGVCAYRTTLEHCDGYVGSTTGLVDHIGRVTGLPAARFDNGVGIALGRASSQYVLRRRRPGPLRIGYFSGTTTHDHDWQFVLPAVMEVMERHPTVQLWAGGYLPDTPELQRFGRRVRRIAFQPWLELPGALRNLDVNLAPLVGQSRFNEAKSAIKWLEAALVETPTVASPTGPFREAIDDGVTGFLAATQDDWVRAISDLLGDPLRRSMVGARARRAALLGWSPWLQGRRYLGILEASFGWREQAADRTSTWSYPLRDEPLDAFPLFPDGLGVPSPWFARLAALGGPRQLPLRTARSARSVARRAMARR
jgi:glycosyltransferase involved in cell wall biosynthesis